MSLLNRSNTGVSKSLTALGTTVRVSHTVNLSEGAEVSDITGQASMA